ncbi:MAG: hypothetical protein ABWW70_06965 [Thermoproteota archaeon]
MEIYRKNLAAWLVYMAAIQHTWRALALFSSMPFINILLVTTCALSSSCGTKMAASVGITVMAISLVGGAAMFLVLDNLLESVDSSAVREAMASSYPCSCSFLVRAGILKVRTLVPAASATLGILSLYVLVVLYKLLYDLNQICGGKGVGKRWTLSPLAFAILLVSSLGVAGAVLSPKLAQQLYNLPLDNGG